MKNELTSTFEQVIYYIWWLNKNSLIRVLKTIDFDNNYQEKILKELKNHELKYCIYIRVIDNLDSMKKVINESIKIKDKKLWLNKYDFDEILSQLK